MHSSCWVSKTPLSKHYPRGPPVNPLLLNGLLSLLNSSGKGSQSSEITLLKILLETRYLRFLQRWSLEMMRKELGKIYWALIPMSGHQNTQDKAVVFNSNFSQLSARRDTTELFCCHLKLKNQTVHIWLQWGENIQFHTSSSSHNIYSGQQYNFEQIRRKKDILPSKYKGYKINLNRFIISYSSI